MPRLTAGLSTALLAAACTAPAPATSFVAPIASPLSVFVDGKGPYPFGYDTGQSSACLVTTAFAEELDLEVLGSTPVDDGSGENAMTVDLVRVPALTVAGVEFPPCIGVVLDPSVDRGEIPASGGVLGFPLFSAGLFTLDGPVMRFEPGELPPPDGETILAFTMPQGLPVIEIDVGPERVEAVVDSANPKALILPTSLVSRLPLEEEPVVTGRMATLFNEFDVLEATLDGELRIGRYRVENPRLEFNDVLPDANVGAGFLEDFAITFDQKNGRLRLLPRASGPATSPSGTLRRALGRALPERTGPVTERVSVRTPRRAGRVGARATETDSVDSG